MEFPAWDPVLIDIPGLPIDVRWYGLMYVVGFVVAQVILTRLAKARFLPLPPDRVADLILYMVIGVLLGGRVGYALFYDQDLLNPGRFVQVWTGGLSFHGGLLGVVVACALFARKHRIPGLRLADALALAVTPGILAVRIANFINGELYGRVTEKGVGLAMRFPSDPDAHRALHLSETWTMRDRELVIRYAMDKVSWEDIEGKLSSVDSRGVEIPWADLKPYFDWDAVKDQVPYRHPSQLYEGLGEGLLVGLVLLGVYLATRRRPLPKGWYSAIFLIGYATVRFFIEFLRQPDRQFTGPNDPIGTVFLGMTMGQLLCVGMALGGVGILALSRKREPAREEDRGDAPEKSAETEATA